MWQGWINVMTGLWVLSCGFFFDLRSFPNLWAPGAVILIFGLWAGKRGNSWQGFFNAIIGIWLILSGIAFNLNTTWNYIISGALISIIAIWNVSITPKSSTVQET
jgi:hypothetical protein